jgi:hypothetical protein
MIIKNLNGEILKININNLKNIFDLKCIIAELYKKNYYDIIILFNGKKIQNNFYLKNLKSKYLICVTIDSHMGYKVKNLEI